MSDLQPPRFSSPTFPDPAQDVHLELVRHYADVLRMLTGRIPSAVSPPAGAAVALDPAPEILETPPDPSFCWEAAVSVLERRDWHTESLVHLWLAPWYVLGLQVLIGSVSAQVWSGGHASGEEFWAQRGDDRARVYSGNDRCIGDLPEPAL